MQYTTSSLGNNPFAVLTAVVAPAILTNACSLLALATSNRLGRVVDRTRVVAGELAGIEPGSGDYQAWTAQLELLQVRAQMLLKALRLFYAALGLFASAALISVGGSIAAYYGQRLLALGAGLAMTTGAAAVVCLAWGCGRMVHETRLAVRNLAEEARLGMKTYRRVKTG
jgi:hypothetical protein